MFPDHQKPSIVPTAKEAKVMSNVAKNPPLNMSEVEYILARNITAAIEERKTSYVQGISFRNQKHHATIAKYLESKGYKVKIKGWKIKKLLVSWD